MPIRINLKELFAADSQESVIDKLNFNFNKLLELGVGQKGGRGNTGYIGPAGPFGIEGDQGIRGNAWFVDAVADPNTITFTDLLAGDFYVNSQTFAVWQYDGTNWQFLFDLTDIINQYLASSPSPFVRGLGIDSPNDDRFILFNRRGNTVSDSSIDIDLSTSADNDILFLTNFNEDLLNNTLLSDGFDFGPALNPSGDQIDTADLYTSLFTVYLNHTSAGSNLYSRHHIELGSLYTDETETVPERMAKMTNSLENLKIKFMRSNDDTSPVGDHYNIAQFSLDKPDSTLFSMIPRISNGVFEFRSGKWPGSGVGSRVQTFIGSRFGFTQLEDASTLSEFKIDGLLFKDEEVTTVAGGVGMTIRYDINFGDFPDDTGYVKNVSGGLNQSYLAIEAIDQTAGILLDSKTLQDGGNFVQLGTTAPREVDLETSAYVAPVGHSDHMGIAVHGSTIYTVSGNPDVAELATTYGYFNRYNIDNPNNPISELSSQYSKFNGSSFIDSAPVGNCASVNYHGNNQPIGPGAVDIAVAGKYAYVLNSQNIERTASDSDHQRTYFQVLELNGMNEVGLLRAARLGEGSFSGSENLDSEDPKELNCAYRIKLRGKHAIIGRNALYDSYSTFPPSFGSSYTGGLAAIDITDPTDPTIVANIYTSTSKYPGSTTYDDNAILDLEVVGDTAYALIFQQSNNFSSIEYEVNLHSYDLSTLDDANPSFSLVGIGSGNISSSSSVNSGAYSVLPKRGALAVSDRYAYAGYGNQIKSYKLNAAAKVNVTSEGCTHIYSSSVVTIDELDGSSTNEILDMKLLGNSLYVLGAKDHTDFYVFKYDVSAGYLNTETSTPAQPVFISSKLLSVPGSRFVVVGKHIYVATRSTSSDDSSQTGLLALDIDGIYSQAAHIESLRTDEIHVVGTASIGGSTTVRGALEVGEGLLVNGHTSVSGDTHLAGRLDATGDVRVMAKSIQGYTWTKINGVNQSGGTDFLRFDIGNNGDSDAYIGYVNGGTYSNTTPSSADFICDPVNYDRVLYIYDVGSNPIGSQVILSTSEDGSIYYPLQRVLARYRSADNTNYFNAMLMVPANTYVKLGVGGVEAGSSTPTSAEVGFGFSGYGIAIRWQKFGAY